MPGDFYLLEVVLQVLCCQEGDRRGSPQPLSRSWEHPQVSDVDFLQPNSIFFFIIFRQVAPPDDVCGITRSRAQIPSLWTIFHSY